MRILFLPYDVLSSVTRQTMLARAFAAAGHEVHFAGEGAYLDLAREEGWPVERLANFATARLLEKLRTFRDRLSDAARLTVEFLRELDLAAYVASEVDLFRRLNPAVVLSEERVTAPLSARIAGVPHVSLRNAYRTPYSRLPLSDLGRMTARLGLDPIRAEQAILRLVAIPFLGKFNRILRRHGVAETWDYDSYVRSDFLVLLCDVPEYSPAGNLPPNHHFIGPLTWESGRPAPGWVRELPPGRATVYVSLGSSGTAALFGRIAEALGNGPRHVVVTTGLQIPAGDLPTSARVHVAELVNAGPILARSTACVCHGGNGTVYQALGHGVPVVAIPTHIEQRWNARRVESLGIGLALDLDEVARRPQVLAGAVERVSTDAEVRSRVDAFREKLAAYDAPRAAVEIVVGALGARS